LNQQWHFSFPLAITNYKEISLEYIIQNDENNLVQTWE